MRLEHILMCGDMWITAPSQNRIKSDLFDSVVDIYTHMQQSAISLLLLLLLLRSSSLSYDRKDGKNKNDFESRGFALSCLVPAAFLPLSALLRQRWRSLFYEKKNKRRRRRDTHRVEQWRTIVHRTTWPRAASDLSAKKEPSVPLKWTLCTVEYYTIWSSSTSAWIAIIFLQRQTNVFTFTSSWRT